MDHYNHSWILSHNSQPCSVPSLGHVTEEELCLIFISKCTAILICGADAAHLHEQNQLDYAALEILFTITLLVLFFDTTPISSAAIYIASYPGYVGGEKCFLPRSLGRRLPVLHTPTSSFADAHPSFSKLVTKQLSSIRYLQCGPLHVLGGGMMV